MIERNSDNPKSRIPSQLNEQEGVLSNFELSEVIRTAILNTSAVLRPLMPESAMS